MPIASISSMQSVQGADARRSTLARRVLTGLRSPRRYAMSEQLEPLRQAASTLIAAAPAGAVLAAMRAMLADWESDRPPGVAAGPLEGTQAGKHADTGTERTNAPAAATAPPQRLPAIEAMAAAQDAEREAWERLRIKVRERRVERGLTVTALAEELGASATTIKTSLGMRRPPSQRLRERLETWVAAPAVAAEAAFRGNNGAGHGTGTARSTANGAARGGAEAEHVIV
jgi:hypothetical protein